MRYNSRTRNKRKIKKVRMDIVEMEEDDEVKVLLRSFIFRDYLQMLFP